MSIEEVLPISAGPLTTAVEEIAGAGRSDDSGRGRRGRGRGRGVMEFPIWT
jgi:hypothetical protein